MKAPMKIVIAITTALFLFTGCSEDPVGSTSAPASTDKLIEAREDLSKAASIVTTFSMEKPEDNGSTRSAKSRSSVINLTQENYTYPDAFTEICTYESTELSLYDTVTHYESDFVTKKELNYDAETIYSISNYRMVTPLFESYMSSKHVMAIKNMDEFYTQVGNSTINGVVTYTEDNFKLVVTNSSSETTESGISIVYNFTFMDGKYSVSAPVSISMEDLFGEMDPTAVLFNVPVKNSDNQEVGRCEVLYSDEITFYDFEGKKL